MRVPSATRQRSALQRSWDTTEFSVGGSIVSFRPGARCWGEGSSELPSDPSSRICNWAVRRSARPFGIADLKPDSVTRATRPRSRAGDGPSRGAPLVDRTRGRIRLRALLMNPNDGLPGSEEVPRSGGPDSTVNDSLMTRTWAAHSMHSIADLRRPTRTPGRSHPRVHRWASTGRRDHGLASAIMRSYGRSPGGGWDSSTRRGM